MSKTAEDDGADGGDHGDTADATAVEEPGPVENAETDETAADESESEPGSDPAALRCGITLGET